ncbi:hypothetical protein CEXT_307911 [Caerostris extrusa]|uniref:Uncharacterized protein n=1 Tax=Caerostris extrusa TaxID=172846 RepID=A0AAV4VX89_CAEEX|nr:hypothetical protein CEXT_307911 [Caerostris extrusa]
MPCGRIFRINYPMLPCCVDENSKSLRQSELWHFAKIFVESTVFQRMIKVHVISDNPTLAHFLTKKKRKLFRGKINEITMIVKSSIGLAAETF